jgi:hypothetical protein
MHEHEKLLKKKQQRMMSCPFSEAWYKAKNEEVEMLCRKLRQKTLPPSWQDQSEE